jgi:hypothetical protein
MIALEERFLSHVNKSAECWFWMGGRTPLGYGIIGVQYAPRYAHRIAYELFVEPIPKGLCVCHTCDNPSCVNPEHLFLGTRKENMQDSSLKGRRFRQVLPEEVKEMFRLRAEGCTYQSIAKTLDRTVSTIWRHTRRQNDN